MVVRYSLLCHTGRRERRPLQPNIRYLFSELSVYAASMDPDSIDSLDSETLFTIQRFFENNLNVSETSRGLFVHRNTLVYRLEKIKKLTGLDLRKFDDAIVFKVALMVKKYLSSDPARY